jgi:Post-segregation antitoxin CcdA
MESQPTPSQHVTLGKADAGEPTGNPASGKQEGAVREWQQRHAAGIAAYNARVEADGVFGEGWRAF